MNTFIHLTRPEKPLINQSEEEISRGLEKAWAELRSKTLKAGKTFLISDTKVETPEGEIIPLQDLTGVLAK